MSEAPGVLAHDGMSARAMQVRGRKNFKVTLQHVQGPLWTWKALTCSYKLDVLFFKEQTRF